MPYGNREQDQRRRQELDSLYEHFIRPAVEAVAIPSDPNGRVHCHRGDKEPGPGEIITHIIENLVLSELAIADLTGRNPNVFYELGVRHAVNDNTILISESEEDVPFDLRGQRLILYKRDFEGGGRLRTEITKSVQDIVHAPGRIDNPVRRFLFDREREKMLKEIEAQGPPPGYDFVNELLQEMSNLRKDFKSQLDEVRQVMQAVTAFQREAPAEDSEASSDNLRFMEGAWRASPCNSHLYARLVHGQLFVPYCFHGNDSLKSRLFNVRRIGENIFARFGWIRNADISGYVQLRIDSHDRLVGGWWYSGDAPEEVVNNTSRMSRVLPRMVPWELTRISNRKTPRWAEDYFNELEQG